MHFRTIDLSHPFTESMPVYPGDPAAVLTCIADFSRGDGMTLSEARLGMHVGTHLDAPLHMIAGGKRISEIPPAHFFGRGVLIDARGRARIDVDLLQSVRRLAVGDFVLISTGFAARYRDDSYYRDYPEVTGRFATALVEAVAGLLGLDSPSPDRAPIPIHKQLLGAGMLLAENLANLDKLEGLTEFEVIALPVNFVAEAAPARVVARTLTP